MSDSSFPIKNNRYVYLLSIAIPFIIYIYFLNWKTDTIYGDDLYIFKDYGLKNSFWEKINLPIPAGKFRPVHGFSIFFVLESFEKNLNAYYLFNIAVQTLNTFLFARLLNLFLKSPIFSLAFSLAIGLSRFTFFNISQLLNGGALEGLAMTFFLLSLYSIVKVLSREELAASRTQRGVLSSILFANLSMYTHERYIVILPFIFIVTILFPGLKALTKGQRIGLGFAALATIALNVVIKKFVYGMPFFVGTGGTNISLSFSSASSFFADAVLSIFQINSGPEYLVGRPFSSLPVFSKALVMLFVAGLLLLLAAYFYRVKKSFAAKNNEGVRVFYTFIFLILLFGFFLVPAVITIRLEQRWLQAPSSIFILLVVIAFSGLPIKVPFIRRSILATFILLYLWSDSSYLHKGAQNLYMSGSEELASDFREAVEKGIIYPSTDKVYIWEDRKDENTENAIKWTLADGYFFEFYQNKSKKLLFADSIYQKSYPFPFSTFVNFNKSAEQIIYIQDHVSDLTSDYLQDSLKSFQRNQPGGAAGQMSYDKDELTISNEDFSNFSVTGFYDYENGIRWTNGNASIGFNGDYTVQDSMSIGLNTYMPSVCKNIVPKVVLTGKDSIDYQPKLSARTGDMFTYKIYFDHATTIKKVSFLSDTLSVSMDVRRLSFPFISVTLKRH